MHLNVSQTSPDFQANDQLINRWLAHRQSLLVALHELINERPFENILTFKHALHHLFANLIDYVSEGQFQVLERIAQSSEQHHQGPLNPNIIYNILKNNVVALDLYEKYGDHNKAPFEQLEADLNVLSEQLADRFELEDSLIDHYLSLRN